MIVLFAVFLAGVMCVLAAQRTFVKMPVNIPVNMAVHNIPVDVSDVMAVIVEPRQHQNLVHVVQNVRDHLPSWPILVMHGASHGTWVRQQLSGITNVKFLALSTDNLTIPEYNALMTSKRLWEQVVSAEHILIFQTDAWLCDACNEHSIRPFLFWDWVGAPWKDAPTGTALHVGNGGLSLRRRSAMLRRIEEEAWGGREPEDYYFCRGVSMRLPPPEIAALFSSETLPSDAPLGTHKPQVYVPACKGVDIMIRGI